MQKQYTREELENMTDAEMEGVIMAKSASNADEVKYVLATLMIEGWSPKVPKNENKGLNWLKDAVKNGHQQALEYKTYWDIRFDKHPKLDKIKENLMKIIDLNRSPRACNTLAELNHASAGSDLAKNNPEIAEAAARNKDNACKYYMISADEGDVIGMHWVGVFYHEGYGVGKNIEKAINYLEKAAAAGNGQSLY